MSRPGPCDPRPLPRSPADAATDADALLLAVHWSRVNDVLKQAGNIGGEVLITCSMPMNASNTALAIAHLAYESDSGPEIAYRIERFIE